MSTTVADILTAVAYRRRQNSASDNANEQARQIRFVDEAQREVLTEQPYWFTESFHSTATIAYHDTYDLPANMRQILEVKVDHQRYQPRIQAQNPSNLFYTDFTYYEYGEDLVIIPTPATTPSALTVSTLTSSSTTATCTTSTNHGLDTGDYVVMAGAVETEYNGTFRIVVTGLTTFNYTLTTTTTTPATGTITATQNNLVIKYHYWPTALTLTTDTVAIPDPYISVLIAYVSARMAQIDGKRGDAADGFDEFNSLVTKMKTENQRRKFGGKAISAEDYFIYENRF